MIKANYHSHSTFCDGKSSMEEMVQSAISHGFTHWGVSSHAPVGFENTFALKEENVPKYLQEFHRLKEKYADKIKMYLGLEIDFITDIKEDNRKQAENYGLDYFIGSVHQVKEHNSSKEDWFIDGHDPQVYDNGLKNIFNNDIRRAVDCFYNQQKRMIELNHPDIVGHFDKVNMHNRGRYFHTDDKWYMDAVYGLIDIIIKNDTIVEVNTRGLYKGRSTDFYPCTPIIRYLVEKNVPIIVSSDCHRAEEVDGFFKQAMETLKNSNCKELYYYEDGWKSADIEEFRY